MNAAIAGTGRVSCGSWGPATGYASRPLEGGEEEVVLDARAPVRIEGRVTAPEGVPVGGLPVFARVMPEWMMRFYGMTALRPDVGLRRQWLPWAGATPVPPPPMITMCSIITHYHTTLKVPP